MGTRRRTIQTKTGYKAWHDSMASLSSSIALPSRNRTVSDCLTVDKKIPENRRVPRRCFSDVAKSSLGKACPLKVDREHLRSRCIRVRRLSKTESLRNHLKGCIVRVEETIDELQYKQAQQKNRFKND